MNIVLLIIGIILIFITLCISLLIMYNTHVTIEQHSKMSELKSTIDRLTIDNANLIGYISQLSNVISELTEISSVLINTSPMGGLNPSGTSLFDDDRDKSPNLDLDNQLQQRLSLSKEEIAGLKQLFKDYFDTNGKS